MLVLNQLRDSGVLEYGIALNTAKAWLVGMLLYQTRLTTGLPEDRTLTGLVS